MSDTSRSLLHALSGIFPLIIFRLKSLARVEIYIVYDYVIMHMGVIYMNGKHILILVIEKCLT